MAGLTLADMPSSFRNWQVIRKQRLKLSGAEMMMDPLILNLKKIIADKGKLSFMENGPREL